MKKPFSVSFSPILAIFLACFAVPTFANRGGGGGAGGGLHGGGGGGSHGSAGGGFQGGGGGFHSSGGGIHSSGGGFHGGSPSAGYGTNRGSVPYSARAGGGFASRPGNNFSRPAENFARGNRQYGNSYSAPPAVADGRWHSFGNPTGGRGPSGGQLPAGSPAGGGFHVFSGNRGAGSPGAVRSFSGQGGEIWENSPSARNVIPRSQSLSILHNSFNAPRGLNSVARPNSTPSVPSRVSRGTAVASNHIFLGSFGGSGRRQLGSTGKSGDSSGFHRGGGCQNCGSRGRGGRDWDRGGWGWGGWGGSWLGYGWWDPFWFDPWWGWSGPAYGFYAYPDNSVYGYPDEGYYNPDDNLAPPQSDQSDQYDPYNQSQYDQAAPNGNWITPNGPSPALAPNSANLAVPVLIYLKNGAVLTVRDYWMVDDELHYVLTSGAQRTVNLELVDLSRTNSENAKSGVRFIFKSEPSLSTPSTPDAEPGAPARPAPTQQLDAAPQPEART